MTTGIPHCIHCETLFSLIRFQGRVFRTFLASTTSPAVSIVFLSHILNLINTKFDCHIFGELKQNYVLITLKWIL